PDVAWASDERLSALSDEDAEIPPFAPEIVVEVRSPRDDLKYLRQKIERCLATGAVLVLDVNPKRHEIIAHTHTSTQVFSEDETFATDAVPWFSFGLRALFAAAERHRR
ncbi:MAG: Uma2 family endonuclease, partial [Candidatus Eremiobacteraeota bacterium]|nr:Uma2 family endonuclease [Candidatus Eremiobacteraeota bacterium]